jgi:peptide/nickel transport system ATP-binding protein
MSVATETARAPLYQVRDLKVHFPIRRSGGRVVRALDGVDLEWRRGEVLGIVGESGCGKSTLGRALLGLQPATSGEILVDGAPLATSDLRAVRRRIQMIFQDPYQSLNPRQTVASLVMEPLAIHGVGGPERVARAVAALESAGLAPAARYWERYPHELSGGQRQRVVIAAAMVLGPEALICDEPVSALDVSVRAQVLHVLMGLRAENDLGLICDEPVSMLDASVRAQILTVLLDLRRRRDLALIFITHDLGLAWALCDRIAVMYLGRIVETGPTAQVIGDPRHPYTQSLLSVVPTPYPREARRQILAGELPDAANVPSGCRFHPRCPQAFDRCPQDDPRALIPAGEVGHGAACWLAEGRPSSAAEDADAAAVDGAT